MSMGARRIADELDRLLIEADISKEQCQYIKSELVNILQQRILPVKASFVLLREEYDAVDEKDVQEHLIIKLCDCIGKLLMDNAADNIKKKNLDDIIQRVEITTTVNLIKLD